ncbi:DUF5793 family protein [Halogeometricum limi]|uniref:Uncharacterized protein n=1 Tax=Halogeometricum limi TaxID=555875 RepID=A0A1I6GUW1_9EURY|nr:DUF5793 family protein [Halogeometricum limi]SFR45916.1 hypothetical protein SAMN04488124_1556 [Halogeometricum limi]
MRRDYFELDVEHIDWVETDEPPEKPSVRIDFHGPEGMLTDRLTDAEGKPLDDGETDVAYRLQGDVTDPDATGVVSVTNRITGDFVLELNEDADDVLRFIRAAREYGESAADGEDGQYRVEIRTDDGDTVVYEKRTFLVYDADGNLLRGHSLIPSGVEL